MGKGAATITIQRPADEVWTAIGRFDDSFWHDGVATCRVEGDIRTVTMSARPDIEIQQRELFRDETQRTYTYGLSAYGGDTVINLPNGEIFDLKSMIGRHRATVAVAPTGPAACFVTYGIEIEDGYDLMLEHTRRGYQTVLNLLKQRLET